MITNPRTKPVLLMIEDNPGDVELFRWVIGEAGIDCDLCVIGDGGAALEFVRREDGSPVPDLVILDLNLPKVSGKEILTGVRSSIAFANVPVVIWTSSNARIDRAQLEPLGITRYFVKPPELSEFLKLGHAIRGLLEELPGKSNFKAGN